MTAPGLLCLRRYSNYLPDSNGSAIPGTLIHNLEVRQTLSYDQDGLICRSAQIPAPTPFRSPSVQHFRAGLPVTG